MKRKFKELREMQLLRKLERAYDVHEVKYDIINYEFTYIKGDEVKRRSLVELINHVYAEVPKDEVQLQLEDIAASYLPEYIKEQITKYYSDNGIKQPEHLYVFKGLIQFIDNDGDEFYVPLGNDMKDIFRQFDKILKK